MYTLLVLVLRWLAIMLRLELRTCLCWEKCVFCILYPMDVEMKFFVDLIFQLRRLMKKVPHNRLPRNFSKLSRVKIFNYATHFFFSQSHFRESSRPSTASYFTGSELGPIRM